MWSLFPELITQGLVMVKLFSFGTICYDEISMLLAKYSGKKIMIFPEIMSFVLLSLFQYRV